MEELYVFCTLCEARQMWSNGPVTTSLSPITYKVRVGDDGRWTTCDSWLDAMRKKDELINRAGTAQVLALRDNGDTFVGKRTYHSDGRMSQTGEMM